MVLKEKLHNDMVSTLKKKSSTKDDLEARLLNIRLSTLRGAIGAVTSSETSGKTRTELNDSEVLSVLRKLVKQGVDSAEIYREAGDNVRMLRELAEVDVLNEYLPRQKSESETRELISAIIAKDDLSGPRAIGQIMGQLKNDPTVDGSVASKIARELL